MSWHIIFLDLITLNILVKSKNFETHDGVTFRNVLLLALSWVQIFFSTYILKTPSPLVVAQSEKTDFIYIYIYIIKILIVMII
jgi:hypothetical protein